MNNEKETIIKGKKEGNISQFGGGGNSTPAWLKQALLKHCNYM